MLLRLRDQLLLPFVLKGISTVSRASAPFRLPSLRSGDKIVTLTCEGYNEQQRGGADRGTRRALSVCTMPGCRALTRETRCDMHRWQDDRPSSRTRGYTRTWEKIRVMHLRREPLCRACLGRGITTAAAEVDHVLSLRRGGTNVDDNLQSLCKPCHSRKTRAES